MTEVIYGFDDRAHHSNHKDVFNPYTKTRSYIRKKKKITWNPYTKRHTVEYATHLPTAVNKYGHPLKWSELSDRQRRQFGRPEKVKNTKLYSKGETVQETKFSGFKKAFDRWVNGKIASLKERANTPAWIKAGNYNTRMLLPKEIRTFLLKSRLSRQDIARFSAWLKHEKCPHTMREYLFYTHYDKPMPYKDGSLPPNHEYFKFEDEVRNFEYDPHDSLTDLVRYDNQRLAPAGPLFEFKSDTIPSKRRYGSAVARRRLFPEREVRYLIRHR